MKIKQFSVIISLGGYHYLRSSHDTLEEATNFAEGFVAGQNSIRSSKAGRSKGAKTKATVVELKKAIT